MKMDDNLLTILGVLGALVSIIPMWVAWEKCEDDGEDIKAFLMGLCCLLGVTTLCFSLSTISERRGAEKAVKGDVTISYVYQDSVCVDTIVELK